MPYYNYKKEVYIDRQLGSDIPAGGSAIGGFLVIIGIIASLMALAIVIAVQLAILYATMILIVFTVMGLIRRALRHQRPAYKKAKAKADAEWNEIMDFINRAKARSEEGQYDY